MELEMGGPAEPPRPSKGTRSSFLFPGLDPYPSHVRRLCSYSL